VQSGKSIVLTTHIFPVLACEWVGIKNPSHFCAYMGMSCGDLYIYQSKISRVYFGANMQT